MSEIPGIVIRSSSYTVGESMERVANYLLGKGFTIYARINQHEELKKVGLNIPALAYILFGNPASGGHLMMENPLVALDLPLKMIAYADQANRVWLAYNDNNYIRKRYNLRPPASPAPSLDDLVNAALK